MELRQTALVKVRKADRSLVTNADHAADRIIREGLRKHFPKHAVLTEESGLEGSPDAEFVWMVDPLDGTKAYARGTPGFSVMIGLLRNRRPFAGVVLDPWEDRLYEALRGEGAFHTFEGRRERVRVSKRRAWREMPLVTSTGFPEPLENKLKKKLPNPWVPAVNSVGIKVGLLVRQAADLYFNHHAVHYWDTAAPQIILEEAGGTFSFSDGRPLVYAARGDFQHPAPTLASNGQRHAEFVRIIRELLQT
jgi:3'(2'), 5'-bisphosphate nucleotidase